MASSGSDNTQTLTFNSIKSVVIHGLLFDNDGQETPVAIPRAKHPLKLHDDCDFPGVAAWYANLIQLTPRPPSPSDYGDGITLHLKLGALISQDKGASHFVYDVTPIHASDSDSLPSTIPPLVLKVAKELNGRMLAQESAVYDHVHTLQGVVVPRCYGYFRQFVNLIKYSVRPWSPGMEDESDESKFSRDPKSFDIFRMPNANASLNVLLLEKVGDHIPAFAGFGRDEWKSGKALVMAELYEMLAELHTLGIPHNDFGYHNVLCAPEGPSALPSIKSPTTGRCYKYRIIDFELSVACPCEADQVTIDYQTRVEELLGIISFPAACT